MMYHGVIESKNFMLKLMDSSSNFDDSKKIEGLYFRIDNNDTLLYRAKLVNKEFRVRMHDHDDNSMPQT